MRRPPGELAVRWARQMAELLMRGILCRGCGYRIPADSWLSNAYTGTFFCPYCHTRMGQL